MEPKLYKIIKAANKIRTPLALSGIIIVVLYALYTEILSLDVFENIGSEPTFQLLEDVINKLFWLALIAIILSIVSYLITIVPARFNKLFGLVFVIIILGIGSYLITVFLNPRRPRSSDLELIDASLDPKDSPYEEKLDNGLVRIEPIEDKPVNLNDSLNFTNIENRLIEKDSAKYRKSSEFIEDLNKRVVSRANESKITPKAKELKSDPEMRLEIDKKQYDYGFPTIDFKFQNKGSITAFIWKFVIEVTEAEIDQTPLVGFELTNPRENKWFYDSDNEKLGYRSLKFLATNSGWGPAYECQFRLEHSTLSQLFPNSTRLFNGTLESGESKHIIELHVNQIKEDEFNRLHKELMSRAQRKLDEQLEKEKESYERWGKKEFESHEKRIREKFNSIWNYSGKTIPISKPSIHWRYTDIEGIRKNGVTAIYNSPEWKVVMGLDKIWWVYEPVTYERQGSDVTYCVVINPSKGKHVRTYPMSRQIRQGDVERFHIMIGASKSSRLRIRLKFFVDKNQIVQSEQFELRIRNPRNSYLNAKYKDGDIILRNAEQTNSILSSILELLEKENNVRRLDSLRILTQSLYSRELYKYGSRLSKYIPQRDYIDVIQEEGHLTERDRPRRISVPVNVDSLRMTIRHEVDSLRTETLKKTKERLGEYPFLEKER